MKKVLTLIVLVLSISLVACTNEKSGSTESSSSGNNPNTDSATTNPVNSEYGTPNSPEKVADSTQAHDPTSN